MSSSKQKDLICSCEHKLFMSNLNDVRFLEDLDKDFRYEIWNENNFSCFLEYIQSEDRWFFFKKAIDFNHDENGNASIHTIEFIEEKENGK